MSLERKYSIYRKIAVFVAINFLVEIFAPTAVWALTGGPSSPEFSSFEPVATTNMVSEFSGDLTYNLPVINVPGVNGGGYAMSLSYHSGTTPEEEASWVGYGWTLNPGAINRGVKGFPDDLDAAPVKYHNQTPANQTIAVGGSVGNIETFSFDLPVSVNSSIRYNNYKGFGYTIGAGVSLAKGVVSLGYSVSDGTGSFSLSVNPAAALSASKKKGETADEKTVETAAMKKHSERVKAQATAKELNKKKDRTDEENNQLNEARSTAAGGSNRSALAGLGSGYGLHNFASASRPTQIVDYDGVSTTLSLSLLLAPTPAQTGLALGAFGSYSRQKNVEESDLIAYGYMYSANAGAGSMMDYFVEKGSTYSKQDQFLGIPFNNADNYSLTGEGLSGGFKIHNRNIGHFHPNSKISVTNIFNVGPEVEVGLNYGGGGDIGVGHQELKVEPWTAIGNFATPGEEDEAVFFQFANDKGGELSYDNGNTDPKRANVSFSNIIPGSKSASANITAVPSIKNGKRTHRSSYIGYNINSDINTVQEGGVYYKAYGKQSNSHVGNGTIDRTTNPTQIGEFSIVNEDGGRYNYGIPVLSRNEKNLQVDLNGIGASNIENRFLVYRDITGSTNTKVGEERPTAYATSYLLTAITSSDYIDRTNNGPSDDDFGGYTKFSYDRAYGGSNWYKWRMPYAGLSYHKNELSNPNDDLGSVADGEKEIYYLEKVETNTHYAIFYTSIREDGLDANHYDDIASTNPAAKGGNALKKLDKIELFAKDPNGTNDELIKTVHFDYDYSLSPGVLNNINGGGKLTLKKVWFEYNGVVEAKISPYQFQYEYPNTDYPTKYDGFENYGPFSSAQQNPSYSPFSIDAWGNYQVDGDFRHENMLTWLDQSGNNVSVFDPAAWQLKVIKLPSGGEIHVQYEQDDYCYVQDKQAHAMVSLQAGNNDAEFIINTEDLKAGGFSLAEKQKLAAIITKEYITGGKKMYFKMLYKLIGNAVPNLTDCNVEYVTGYADVHNVEVRGTDLVVTLKNQGYSLPTQVCEDYVTTQRAGNLSSVGSNCDPSGGATIGGGSPTEKVLGFIGKAATWFASLAPGTTCLEMNHSLSYLKIPLLDAKKGGGIRVKRLLMYDKGVDAGVPVLYGSEYIYMAYDEERKEYRSSGVATNEPGAIREENALVGFLPRFKQSFFQKIVSGRDKEQSEGPLGESILPGPSVGYSRVITKSIHSGKTNPGLAIKEFYTAKDYPVKAKMTDMDRSHKDYLPLITGLVNKITNNVWASQGYAFEINSMHGQLKSSSTYAGDYSDILNPNAAMLVSQEVMTYFQPGEELPILDPTDLSYSTTMSLGKEMDMAFESKAVKDINVDGNIEFDADAGIFGIAVLPFLSAFPTMTYSETELYTHTTTKVISYPAILKSTKSYADGIYHITENVAFNPETGQPIMTRTTDGFEDLNLLASNNHDGTYTKYTFPASLEYENVSQKAKNEGRRVATTTSIQIDQIEQDGKNYLFFSALTQGGDVCSAMSNFVGGDLIKLSSGGVYHTGDVSGSKIEIHPTKYSTVTNNSASAITVDIIRSGRTNQLNASVGSLTTYGVSNVITTPIPSSIMTSRQAFADLLTDAIEGNIDTIFPEDIPAGLQFINPDGSCTPFNEDHYILIEGNSVNIYSGLNGETIVGTPADPHPMVDTLNAFLNRFYNYPLDPVNAILECDDATNKSIYEISATNNSSVSTMIAEQDIVLARTFSDVNGGTYAISDLFYNVSSVEEDTKASRTGTASNPISMLNKYLLLYEVSNSSIYGFHTVCGGGTSEGPLFLARCKDTDYITSNTSCSCGFGESSDGYLTFSYSDASPCRTDVRFIKPAFPELICSSPLEMSGGDGHFEVDPKTAALVYFAEDNNCNSQGVPCLQFCPNEYPSTAVTKVVASEASTLNDHWNYDENLYSATGNDYETGKRGKWRTERTYAFKTDVDRLSTNFEKNYNSGTYELELFNWEILNANGPKWLELNKVTSYSPNGNALEEKNILGIESAAKFGYNKTMPYLIAQNAAYSSIAFESFENNYGTTQSPILEDNISVEGLDGELDNTTSHSGKSSFKLVFPANDGIEMTQMVVDNQILEKGMLFKTWIKTDFDDRSILDNYLKAEVRDVTTNQLISKPFKRVAQVGDWYLYEAKILPTDLSGVSIGNPLRTFVKYEFSAHGSENVWIDDIRIQPMDAQATAYVYDVVTHRLLTTFDDQHFGLFYQYNAEGKLVRKLIETERGMKTVQETQYNTPKTTPRN